MYIFAAILGCFLTHEGGHYLTALCFGHRLKFRFEREPLGKVLIPRYAWDMPKMERWKQRILALSGFGAEFLVVPVFYALTLKFWLWYLATAMLHLTAYRWYAGKDSDFNWL